MPFPPIIPEHEIEAFAARVAVTPDRARAVLDVLWTDPGSVPVLRDRVTAQRALQAEADPMERLREELAVCEDSIESLHEQVGELEKAADRCRREHINARSLALQEPREHSLVALAEEVAVRPDARSIVELIAAALRIAKAEELLSDVVWRARFMQP